MERVVELMEANLREDPTNDADIRLWFQAYRRLPRFSFMEAISRLDSWAAVSTNSLDAHYYLYILHYLLWKRSVERNEEQIEFHLEKCRQLATGRRRHAYEWLAKGDSGCSLVHHTELGIWKDRAFYTNSEPLGAENGVIIRIKPQAGLIKVGEHLRAFFVPGTKYTESAHINTALTFYLGFSYDGLRAWPIEVIQELAPSATSRRPYESAQDGNADTAAIRPGIDPWTGWAIETLRDRVATFLRAAVAISARKGDDLYVSELRDRLKAEYAGEPVYARLGHRSLLALLRSINGIELVQTAGVDRLRPSGSVLEGIRNTTGKRETTTDQSLDSQVRTQDDELQDRVMSFVHGVVASYECSNVPLALVDLTSMIRAEFRGAAVWGMLGFANVSSMLRSDSTLRIVGTHPALTVRRVRDSR